MGLIPLGTGNLLARNIHLDVYDLNGNVQTALFGHQRLHRHGPDGHQELADGHVRPSTRSW